MPTGHGPRRGSGFLQSAGVLATRIFAGVLAVASAVLLLSRLGTPTTLAGGTEGAWSPTSENGALQGRYLANAVWSGTEMLVFGGFYCSSVYGCADGELYNPATDTWTPIPSLPYPHPEAESVWAGTELMIWGGQGHLANFFGDGEAYSPASDAWHPVSAKGEPSGRDQGSIVWTGNEVLIWGGAGDSDVCASEICGDGGRYDPAADTWKPMSGAGAPSPRSNQGTVWTGTEMVVWGGRCSSGLCAGGGAYNPASDTWRPINQKGAPPAAYEQAAVWTGTEMLVWGGRCQADPCSGGGAYNPTSDTWRPISALGAPSARTDATAVWTGSEMLVWGGQGPQVTAQYPAVFGDGAAYNPATDAWRPLPVDGAPSPRHEHVAVWTGTEMLIWGGEGQGSFDQRTPIFGDGAAYTPPGFAPPPTAQPDEGAEANTK